MPVWLFYALGTVVLWGAGQVMLKAGLVRMPNILAYLVYTLLTVVVWVPYAFLTGDIRWNYMLIAMASSILHPLGDLLYFKAIQAGKVSLVGTVMASYPIFTLISAALILGESTDWSQRAAIAVIMAGIGLMAWQREKGKEHIPVMRWLPLALGCAIIFGTGTMVSKWGIDLVGNQTYILGEAINRVLISMVWLPLNRTSLRQPIRSDRFPALALGNLFMVAGALSIVIALELGQASLVSPVASSASLATLLLARIFLKEHLTHVQWAGAIAAALGIIWIGAVS